VGAEGRETRLPAPHALCRPHGMMYPAGPRFRGLRTSVRSRFRGTSPRSQTSVSLLPPRLATCWSSSGSSIDTPALSRAKGARTPPRSACPHLQRSAPREVRVLEKRLELVVGHQRKDFAAPSMHPTAAIAPRLCGAGILITTLRTFLTMSTPGASSGPLTAPSMQPLTAPIASPRS
jgi:hypothetical protein